MRATVGEQTGLIEKLRVEIAELRARLNMNSRNSSNPPSSDGYAKPAPRSRRKRSGKKPGKQPGTRDAISRSVPIPMRRRSTRRPGASAVRCRGDGDDRPPGVRSSAGGIVLHRASGTASAMPLRRRDDRVFPPEATAPACYGPALRAYMCYLVTRQHIPVARVAELLRDTYGAPVATGRSSRWSKRARRCSMSSSPG